jgi:hypothetical protein
MFQSFVNDVLSSRKQRERFSWFRVMITLVAALLTGSQFSDMLAIGVGIITLPIAYMTVAPVLAFVVCLIEGMFS